MELPSAINGEKPHISVFLSNKDEASLKYFHCSVCGHKVFGYTKPVKIIMAGHGEFNKSFLEVQCSGAVTVIKNGGSLTTRCKAVYRIA